MEPNTRHHRKSHVQQLIAERIDPHIVGGTEPEGWEAVHLLQAIGALACGLYDLAEVLVEKSGTPANHRVDPVWTVVPTSKQLRQALTSLEPLAPPAD